MAARKKKEKKAERKADLPLIGTAARILETGRRSKFEHEATVRHGLRSAFCLDGAPWQKADSRAARIVEAALHRIGAARPTWLEAQPDVILHDRLLEFTRCTRCGNKLPADAPAHARFCSDTCKNSALSNARNRMIATEGEAGRLAYVAAWTEARKKKIGQYLCETCGTKFERKWKPEGYRFCSHKCSNVRAHALESRACAHCRQEYFPTRAHGKYCGEDCRKAASKAYMAAYHKERSPPPAERPCAVCGRPFCPAREDALYCSHACNNRAYRARQRGGTAEFRCEAAE